MHNTNYEHTNVERQYTVMKELCDVNSEVPFRCIAPGGINLSSASSFVDQPGGNGSPACQRDSTNVMKRIETKTKIAYDDDTVSRTKDEL